MLPKSREVTKIDHTVWPPPINGRKNRKDSHFHSGRVQVLLCCACVKPPQSSSGHSESAGSDPDQTQQPPPPLRTSQKAPNEPDAGTRCNTTTHTRSHSVHANGLSFARTTVQLVHYSAPSHNKPRQTPKNLRILGIKAILANSTNLPSFFGFLLRNRGKPRKTSEF